MRERFPKTRFILKILPLLLSILICFVGCEKESIYELETENSTEKINREVSIKEITFQEIEDHSLLDEVKSNLKRNKTSYADKNGIKDIYDFEIDSNQIKEIKRGDKTSYTILIHRNSGFFEGFENLVVYRDKEDLPQAFLMQYPDASKVEMIDGHNSFYYHGEPTLIPLLDIKKTGLASRAIEVCYSVATTYCSWGGKHHVAGAACMAANDDRTYNVSRQYCTWFDTGSGIESIPGSGGSGGGGGGKGSQGDDIDTSPTLENGPLFKFKMYARDYLNSDQRQYLYYQNDNYRNKLLIYLERNGFSSNAKAFARYVIEFGRTNQTKPHDYWKSLEVMSEGLKKFGGSKGADYAKYIDDVLSTGLEPLEARIFYEQMKPIVEQFNAKMLGSIVYAFASGIKPIIEMALFEIGGTFAIKLLSKLPAAIKTVQITKAIKNIKGVNSLSKFKYAKKFGIKSYAEHEKFFEALNIKRSELGVEVHHLIERRLVRNKEVAKWLGSNTKDWESIVLTVEEHRKFTKVWRLAIGYEGKAVGSTGYRTLNVPLNECKIVARKIYKNYPELLKALNL